VIKPVEGRPLDDTESGLVERARHGDIRAYEELVRRYQDVAFRLAYTILGSAEEAEDAAQEGFVRAYHALDRFRRGAAVRPWLLTIVANAARTRRATAARRPVLTLHAVATSLDDSARSPEAVALITEQRRELLSAVNALRDDDQRVIAYRYFLDLSEAEMAQILGCARGTVKSRLSRALTRLRQQLATGAPAGEGGHRG
jgi:RNA polymerase sigma factor (sigma-70 family)